MYSTVLNDVYKEINSRCKKWWLWHCAQAAIYSLILHLKIQWDKNFSQLEKAK
jgi:hypothetical protein